MCCLFTENIDDLAGCELPIDTASESRASYQTSQTACKIRMEGQDLKWKEKRDFIHVESMKSFSIDKASICALCQASVRCQTYRYHLCPTCDITVHSKQVTHQRKCEVNNYLHSLLGTEFLTYERNLITLSIFFHVNLKLFYCANPVFYFIFRKTFANVYSRPM
jgi:hypothetical protein